MEAIVKMLENNHFKSRQTKWLAVKNLPGEAMFLSEQWPLTRCYFKCGRFSWSSIPLWEINWYIYFFWDKDNHQWKVSSETTTFGWIWSGVSLVQSDCRIPWSPLSLDKIDWYLGFLCLELGPREGSIWVYLPLNVGLGQLGQCWLQMWLSAVWIIKPPKKYCLKRLSLLSLYESFLPLSNLYLNNLWTTCDMNFFNFY